MVNAGWYPDPWDAEKQRFWDGQQWTDRATWTVEAAKQRRGSPASSGAPGAQVAQQLPQALIVLHKALVRPTLNALNGEQPLFAIAGSAAKEALVATDHRCVIVKSGYMTGNTFGSRVTSFQYRDIQSVQTRMGMLGVGYLEIVTPGYPNQARNVWTSGSGQRASARRGQGGQTNENADPSHAPNCMTINKRSMPAIQPLLQRLEQMVRASHSGYAQPAQQSAASPTVAAQLAQLAQLHSAGALTAAEFAAAKARLLG